MQGRLLALCVLAMLLPQQAFRAANKVLLRAGFGAQTRLFCNSGGLEAVSEEIKRQGEGHVKRKVALVAGYVGTKYYGLQMDPNSTLPTVESQLESALHKIGCITDSNHRQLSKIGWSRSSRTDKGVHAARIVISAKLEIKNSWLETNDLKAPTIARLANHHLPDDIRIFAAAKMNQGFRARESCHFREYEYILPLSFLTANAAPESEGQKTWKPRPTNGEEAMEHLNLALQKMIGTHSFHNYHKLSPKNLRSKARPHAVGDEAEEEEEEEEDGEEAEVAAVSEKPFTGRFFDPWIKRDRDTTSPKTRCVIYTFAAAEVRALRGVEVVVIRVRGQAFLLHQIRLMISAAVLATRGVIPYSAVDFSLLAPYHVNFPLAPAQGLILVDAGFSRNANGITVSINGQQGRDASYVIMTEAEYDESERWKRMRIYEQVSIDFEQEGRRLQSEFLEYASRFHVPVELEEEWAREVAAYNAKEEKEAEVRTQREEHRIEREIKFFRKELLWRDENFEQHAAKFEAEGDEEQGQVPALSSQKQKPMRSEAIPHKKLLPNALSTDMVIAFGELPSSVTLNNALRALATRMVLNDLDNEGVLAPDMSNEEVISFIRRTGGLDHWASQPKHRFIE